MEFEGARKSLECGQDIECHQRVLRELEPLVGKLYVSGPSRSVDARVVDYWSLRSHCAFDSSSVLDAYLAAERARDLSRQFTSDPNRIARIERLSASAAAVNNRIGEALAHATNSVIIGNQASALAAARGRYSALSIRTKYVARNLFDPSEILTARDIDIVAEHHSASLACAGELLLLKAELTKDDPDCSVIQNHFEAAESLMSYESEARLLQRLQLAEAAVRTGVATSDQGLARNGLVNLEQIGVQMPAQVVRLTAAKGIYANAFES